MCSAHPFGIVAISPNSRSSGRDKICRRLSREERVALAERWGVRSLILDRNGPLRRRMPPRLVERLTAQSGNRRSAGFLLRFDLR